MSRGVSEASVKCLTWIINGSNAGTLDSKVFLNAVANLIGGTGVDQFKFQSTGAVRSITGGGAPTGMGDWLDYTEFAMPVTVNLATGSATNVNGGAAGAVTDIMNVHGGSGGGSLTGNSTAYGQNNKPNCKQRSPLNLRTPVHE